MMDNKLVDSTGLKKFAECFYQLMGTTYNPYTTDVNYESLAFDTTEIVVDVPVEETEPIENTPSE